MIRDYIVRETICASVKNIYFSLFDLVSWHSYSGCLPIDYEPCPECPEPVPCPPTEPCPNAKSCTQPLVAEVPYEAQWAASGHADATADAFRHWDDDGMLIRAVPPVTQRVDIKIF